MNAIQKKLSVVIVNYCTPDLVKTCVQSLRQWQIAKDDQIIVVDNASPDGSFTRLCKELDGIKILNSGRNGGLSYGINIGAKEASCEYLLILNPDTYFIDNSIGFAFEFFDKNPDVGLIGLDLIYPDGRRQLSARRFYSVIDIFARRLPIGRYWLFKRRLDKHMMLSDWEKGIPFNADWVMGTGFIIRRNLFQNIGGMNESYFIYMEDVDLCTRIWLSGSRVVCVPNARLVHHHQRSSASGIFSWAGRTHIKSLLTYSRKYRVPLLTSPTVDTIKRF
ncbi:MAG: glycosyltransferase family 2 protein [Betaproteobacteria bacterium]|nr:glycosyltransferase family 2 protein [Betaproteobacteria bacterium]